MFKMSWINLAFVMAVCVASPSLAWLNNFDAPFNFICPKENQFVNHISSIHSNHYEDRVFEMTCKEVAPVESTAEVECKELDRDVNYWDALLAYQCEDDFFINGLGSHHDNHREDREWNVRCCSIRGVHMHGCHYTDWTNNWDAPQDFTVGPNLVLKGMISIHDNHKEDRRYMYEVCHASRGGDVIFGKRRRQQRFRE